MSASSLSTHPVKKPRRLRYDQVFGLLLISPWLLGLVLFKLLPILASLAISFTNFYMLEPGATQFVGLENYARFFEDRIVAFLLFQTLSAALATIPLQLLASIILAALLASPRIKGKTLMRTLFFLPSVIPSIALLFMWFGFLDPTTGWLNRFILEPLGLGGQGGIFAEGAFRFVFAISSLWSIGPGVLIMLGAIQSVSPEIIEAARVDGAGPFMRFFSITLPMSSPAIFFSLIINLITVFGGVILLDRGTTFGGSNSPFDQYITMQMFDEFDLGYASALAWGFFVIVMVVVYFIFSTSRKWVYYPDRD
jgi:multiple sugar transport system permease protein